MWKLILGKCLICLLIVASIIGAGIYFSSQKSEKSEKADQVGIKINEIGVVANKLAQDFSLTTIEGKNIKLSDFQGKHVLFAFMAPWCGTCLIEAENVREVQKDKDFIVIQIGIGQWVNEESLINFREAFGKEDWILAVDKNLEIANLYQVKSLDTTLVLNPEGKIIYRDDGWPIDPETLRNLWQ